MQAQGAGPFSDTLARTERPDWRQPRVCPAHLRDSVTHPGDGHSLSVCRPVLTPGDRVANESDKPTALPALTLVPHPVGGGKQMPEG